MAFETGWRSRLQKASFRGVTFDVDDEEGTFGRRVQVHEYPLRDKPYTEDLGRSARRITINAYIIGDDYQAQRDRLIAAIESEGMGTLIHPFYGQMRGNVDGGVRISHTKEEGRMCRVSFAFVESGELSFPTAGIATGPRLVSSLDSLKSAIATRFSGFSLAGLPDFLQSDIFTDGAAYLNFISDSVRMIDSGVSAAMRLLSGDLSVLGTPGGPSQFIDALSKAWRSGKRLAGDSADLVSMIKTMSGVTLDHNLAPRGKWERDSGTVAARKDRSNQIVEVIRGVTLIETARAVTLIPDAPQIPGTSRQSSAITKQVNVFHPALDAIESQEIITRPPTYDELTDIRETLNKAIDKEQLRTLDDLVFIGLLELRSSLNRDITTRLSQAQQTIIRTPRDVVPALVLACEWYDDAGRETDILYRNKVSHPGFVPVTALRVPVK